MDVQIEGAKRETYFWELHPVGFGDGKSLKEVSDSVRKPLLSPFLEGRLAPLRNLLLEPGELLRRSPVQHELEGGEE